MEKVKKAVILAAGFGTRVLPASKAIPKEMLNIVDKPAIQYIVEEVINSGITEILIVLSRGKQEVEDHFDRSPELEEKLAKPKVSAEFMTFWLHRFRKLDVRQQSHRKMLIDAFINAIFLYDDKMVITFNYKEGTKTITLAELQEAISNKNGSDLDCLAAPVKILETATVSRIFLLP